MCPGEKIATKVHSAHARRQTELALALVGPTDLATIFFPIYGDVSARTLILGPSKTSFSPWLILFLHLSHRPSSSSSTCAALRRPPGVSSCVQPFCPHWLVSSFHRSLFFGVAKCLSPCKVGGCDGLCRCHRTRAPLQLSMPLLGASPVLTRTVCPSESKPRVTLVPIHRRHTTRLQLTLLLIFSKRSARALSSAKAMRLHAIRHCSANRQAIGSDSAVQVVHAPYITPLQAARAFLISVNEGSDVQTASIR